MASLQLPSLLGVLTSAALLTACADDGGTPSDTEATGADDGDGDGATMPPTTPPPTTDPTPGMTDDTTGTPVTDDGPPMTDDGTPTTDDGTPTTDDGSSTMADSSSSEGGTQVTCPAEAISGPLPISVQGTTVGGTNDFTLTCSEGNSTEYTFEFTAPADGWYQFDTMGSEFDTVLALYDACDADNIACTDDTGPDMLYSTLLAELSQGQSVIVVIDGYNRAGAFTLNIAESEAPPLICAFSGAESPQCTETLAGDTPTEDTLSCDDAGVFFHFDLYEIPVAAGDCLFASVDNVGAGGPTGAESADPLLIIVDPATGDYALFDDEMTCSDPTFGGPYGCPLGGTTVADDGTRLLGVAQWPGNGCPDGAPYTLTVGINGVDIDIGAPMTQDEPTNCG